MSWLKWVRPVPIGEIEYVARVGRRDIDGDSKVRVKAVRRYVWFGVPYNLTIAKHAAWLWERERGNRAVLRERTREVTRVVQSRVKDRTDSTTGGTVTLSDRAQSYTDELVKR